MAEPGGLDLGGLDRRLDPPLSPAIRRARRRFTRASRAPTWGYGAPPGGGAPVPRWSAVPRWWRSVAAAGAGDEGGHDVGGVPVQRLAGPVVAHRRAGIRMRRRFLHVPQ